MRQGIVIGIRSEHWAKKTVRKRGPWIELRYYIIFMHYLNIRYYTFVYDMLLFEYKMFYLNNYSMTCYSYERNDIQIE